MKNKDLKRHFEAIGAKVKFHLTEKVRGRWDQSSDHFTIGIQVDKNGEYFDIVQGGDAPEFELLQAQPKTKHLLLYTKEGQRFLCGHDERHWFVAAIGGKVSTVRAAKQSLLPKAIWKQVKHLPPREG